MTVHSFAASKCTPLGWLHLQSASGAIASALCVIAFLSGCQAQEMSSPSGAPRFPALYSGQCLYIGRNLSSMWPNMHDWTDFLSYQHVLATAAGRPSGIGLQQSY